jgi:branched-chain amino acid transport system substrate-binding protein
VTRRSKRLVLPLLALVLAACGPPHPSRVVVGVALAANTHAGIRVAVQEINAAGGIGGARLDVEGLDWPSANTYTPEIVLENATRLTAVPGLLAVIGHSDSASTLTASPTYNRAGIPQIVTIATNPAITNIGSWTYRLCLSDAAQGPALAAYAVNDWHKKRIALLYVNDDYGRSLARLFEQRVRALGGEIVGTAMHHNALQPDDEEAIRDALEDLKKTGPDLVVLFQRVAAARWTLGAIRNAGMDVDILGSDNLAQFQFARDARAVPNRIRVSQFVNLDPSRPCVARFMARIREATGLEADYAQAYAYDAVYLLRDAMLSGGYSRSGIKSYLDGLIEKRQPVDGVTGPFLLGSDHDARRPLYISEVRDGAVQMLKSLPVE